MQITLPMDVQSSYLKEDFIISASNRRMYDVIHKWPNVWGVNPYFKSLIIHGPPSSGKTYIAKLWQNISNAYAISIDNDLHLDCIDEHSSFIIEDIDKIHDEHKLFHYFNFINESQKYLLMTTSRSEIKFRLNDISSRINSVMKLNIDRPDDELIKILIFKYFSVNSIKISDNVIEFLIKRLPRQLDEIYRYIQHINDTALIHHSSITIPFIKKYVIT
ncbi:MAG: DnaA/Hda family protein [Rickettsiaceae bacterium]